MKLIYITNSRIPTEKAHGIQIAKMCNAFAQNGVKVVLLVPRRRSNIKTDIFTYYDIPKSFKIIKLPVIDFIGWHIPFAFFIETASFAASSLFWLMFQKGKAIVYTRGEISLFLTQVSSKRYALFWESHIKPHNMNCYKNVFTKTTGIIVITKHYLHELIKSQIDKSKLLFVPDAVDVKLFNIELSKKDARTKLNLPQEKRIIVYTGSDIPWKGLSILRDAVKYFPDDVLVIFVGDIARKSESEEKVYFAGHRPSAEIIYWLKAADLLVLTGDPKSDIARFYTSPLKLFEYMASGRPIIATDIPSFRDILNEQNACLTTASTGEEFASTIIGVLDNPNRAVSISGQAKKDSRKYDWEERAKNILDFIKTRI